MPSPPSSEHHYTIIETSDGPDDPVARLEAARVKLAAIVFDWRNRFSVEDGQSVDATYPSLGLEVRSNSPHHVQVTQQKSDSLVVYTVPDIPSSEEVGAALYAQGNNQPLSVDQVHNSDHGYEKLSWLIFMCDDIELTGRTA
jgi:hypothetical protein